MHINPIFCLDVNTPLPITYHSHICNNFQERFISYISYQYYIYYVNIISSYLFYKKIYYHHNI